jgi:hypothetical protein
MHAELIFKIPEESMEFQMASWGHRYWATLSDIRETLRTHNKYEMREADTLLAIKRLMDDINPLMEEL